MGTLSLEQEDAGQKEPVLCGCKSVFQLQNLEVEGIYACSFPVFSEERGKVLCQVCLGFVFVCWGNNQKYLYYKLGKIHVGTSYRQGVVSRAQDPASILMAHWQ